MLKALVKIILIAFLGLVAFLLYNTFTFSSKQVAYEAAAPVEVSETAVKHFRESIKIKTVSHEHGSDFDSASFGAFTDFLSTTYPYCDSLLMKEVLNSYSHLYKWQGTNTELKPIVLMAHLDVVPVIEANKADWKHDAFGAELIGDTIWGRGAIDDKVGVIGILEAAEQLLKDGYMPKRTIYFAFGHDEEVGGRNGAAVIAQYLKEQNVQAEFVLDEGGVITQDIVPGIDKKVGLICIAEKGFVSLKLNTKIKGGHSSMPDKETAIDVMAYAIANLKANPFPTRISEPVQAFIDHVGPEMPFGNKLAFANSAVLGGVIKMIYEKKASTNAQVRTTTAPTIFCGGVKENIIPQEVAATVNFRILPGETIEDVVAHVKKVIHDDRIEVTIGEFTSEPSPVSDITAFGYTAINKTIKQTYDDIITTPGLMVGATDSRSFTTITDNVYRFLPIKITPSNIKCFHGVNERIALSEFKDAVCFYTRLMLNVQ